MNLMVHLGQTVSGKLKQLITARVNLMINTTSERLKQFQNHCAAGSVAEMKQISLDNNVTLCVVSVKPATMNGYPPVIFVPGLVSVIETFSRVVKELTRDFEVHYIETREKSSSRLPAKAGLGIEEISGDLAGIIEKLGMADRKYLLVSYSLGATAAAESFRSELKIKPGLLVMIEPSAEFRIPKIGRFVARYFAWTYGLIKPLIKLYIKTFLVDAQKDYEMYMITVRAIDSAHAGKISKTLLAVSDYSLWGVLDKIDVPALVIGASNDTFHSFDDSLKISSMIKDSSYTDLICNNRTHSNEVVEIIRDYLKSYD